MIGDIFKDTALKKRLESTNLRFVLLRFENKISLKQQYLKTLQGVCWTEKISNYKKNLNLIWTYFYQLMHLSSHSNDNLNVGKVWIDLKKPSSFNIIVSLRFWESKQITPWPVHKIDKINFLGALSWIICQRFTKNICFRPNFYL